MRRIRYVVAISLDGYIAGPKGEYDWIITDPEIDFGELFSEFDTVLMGRHSFELVNSQDNSWAGSMKTFVFSKTLRQQDFQGVTIISGHIEETLSKLLEAKGKDIWLFGGGLLFRSLLDIGFVHTIEVAVIPQLLGEGIPFLPPPAKRAGLELTGHRVYETGIVSLEYAIKQNAS